MGASCRKEEGILGDQTKQKQYFVGRSPECVRLVITTSLFILNQTNATK